MEGYGEARNAGSWRIDREQEIGNCALGARCPDTCASTFSSTDGLSSVASIQWCDHAGIGIASSSESCGLLSISALGRDLRRPLLGASSHLGRGTQ
jgi:hypothetical protein